MARRVLPTPPGPVSVTSRLRPTALWMAATSVARPKNRVASAGSLPPCIDNVLTLSPGSDCNTSIAACPHERAYSHMGLHEAPRWSATHALSSTGNNVQHHALRHRARAAYRRPAVDPASPSGARWDAPRTVASHRGWR